MENKLNSWKKTKNIIIVYRKYRTLFRCLYRNLAQKLKNSVQIVKITGHAWQRKVELSQVGKLSLAEHLQGR